jgi:hypothetical protein
MRLSQTTFVLPAWWTIIMVFVAVPAYSQKLSAARPESKVDYDPGGKPIASWTGSGLVAREAYESPAPVVHVFNSAGHEITTRTFEIPGSYLVQARSAAYGSDGTVAICGFATSAQGQMAPYIAWVPLDGSVQQTIRTDPFFPEALAIAPDGTFWAAGRELQNGRETAAEYFILRHLDRSGRLIGGYVPRSLYPKTLVSPAMESLIQTVEDRVGWYAPSAKEYIEVKDSKTVRYEVTGNLKTGERIRGLAITTDGMAYVGFFAASKELVIKQLDRASRTWRSVQVPTESRGFRLFGADGSQLVLGGRDPVFKLRAYGIE